MAKLWRQLLTEEVLTRGWHLARLDSRNDFTEDLFSTDVYGFDLKHRIRETINRIQTGTYQPRPLLRMEVPKGALAFRPGTVVPIADRVVLSAIILLMAPLIDAKLSKSVYSWRIKDPPPKKGSIFRETAITDLPFLKKGTIRREVDPFEPWYQLWPMFDAEARNVFLDKGYRYLATSDIAAYFENIQLLILRDQLLALLPQEHQLVNLLCLFLESWAERTTDGRPHMRGIPQGNFVSSFLGNLFLRPLDQQFDQFCSGKDIVYYRYMDDVRVHMFFWNCKGSSLPGISRSPSGLTGPRNRPGPGRARFAFTPQCRQPQSYPSAVPKFPPAASKLLSAERRFSMISAARTSGSGRLSRSVMEASFSQNTSRFALLRRRSSSRE